MMLRTVCFRLYKLCKILPIVNHSKSIIKVPKRFISIAGRNNNNNNIVNNEGQREDTNNDNKTVEWKLILDYAFRSNLLKFSDSEIRDWLKLYDDKVDIDSIHIRNVNSHGQKYVTYLSKDDDDQLCQWIVVRGTKNWKNIKTSLQYTVGYNDEFEMYLHNGYGKSSSAILSDLKQYLHPNAKYLNLTGHSYGGVVCCCVASNLQKTSTAQINQIITFGMPQFSTSREMKQICNELPLMQVQHIRDHIAKSDWSRIISKRNNKKLVIENNENDQDIINENIIYIGDVDDYTNSSLKSGIIHRMSSYINSIEKHILQQQQDQDEKE